jgi:hypothetical protein
MFANADYVKSQIGALCTDQTKIVVSTLRPAHTWMSAPQPCWLS